jgi:hypothetical protein
MPGAVEADDLERRALEPALAMLDARSLTAVQLIATGNGAVLRWTARRPALWRRIAMRLSRPTFEFPPASGT